MCRYCAILIWRNIDTELLREHSVCRYCAYYKDCKLCVILSFASLLASKLRKKSACKKLHVQFFLRKSEAGIELGIFYCKAATSNHSATQLSLYIQVKFMPYIHSRRNFCTIFVHVSTYVQKLCKVGTYVQNCALKNHYSAPHTKRFLRLGRHLGGCGRGLLDTHKTAGKRDHGGQSSALG